MYMHIIFLGPNDYIHIKFIVGKKHETTLLLMQILTWRKE